MSRVVGYVTILRVGYRDMAIFLSDRVGCFRGMDGLGLVVVVGRRKDMGTHNHEGFG